VADHADLDGLYLQLLALQAQLAGKGHPLLKGAVLTAISVVILWVLIKGFFETLLGNFGLAYFNPGQLTKLPGVTEFFAIEYAALACLMFAAIASWLSPAWVVACEEVPWQDMKQPGKGISILVMTFFLSTVVYFMTMHSHMGILYYPWQYFTSIAPPYWERFADTVSGNFHVSWIMCCTVTVWIVETIWERFPFKLIKTTGCGAWWRFSASSPSPGPCTFSSILPRS
jgi:amino acid transporter, AAT family